MEKWTTLKEEAKLKAKIFSYVQIERQSPLSGKKGLFDRLDCNDWVNIIARKEDGTFVFVRQYRQGTDEITEEIPGGAIDKGEDPLIAAKRELVEETGYESDSWKRLGAIDPNPAILSNQCFVYFADNVKETGTQKFDDLEEIELTFFSYQEVMRKITEGEVKHSLVLAAFLLFASDQNSLLNFEKKS